MKKILIKIVLGLGLCAGILSFVVGKQAEAKDFNTKTVTIVKSVKNKNKYLVYKKTKAKKKAKYLFYAKKTGDYVYAKTYLNVRKAPSTKSKVVKVLSPGQKIYRIAKGARGWDIVKIGKKRCFLSNKYIQKTKPKVKKREVSTSALYSASYFKRMGVIRYNGYRWTWYSQKVLAGGGLSIPGRHVDSNGYICDGDGYIVLASNEFRKGTVISTPFGKMGKFYDCGCPYGTIDVYVNF